MSGPLGDKSKAFALEIIKICNEIKRSSEKVCLTNQLIRSGTSIGANIREAFLMDIAGQILSPNSRLP